MDVGEKINRLTLLEKIGTRYVWENKQKVEFGLFECECGNLKEIPIRSVRSENAKSCGCYAREQRLKASIKHGYSKHPLYGVWENMKARCFRENNKTYKNYGGRGITICDEWLSAKAFCEWGISNGYEEGLHLDRINNNGDYCPENCHFIKQSQNNGVGKRRKKKDNTSGFIGVYWHKSKEKWDAKIGIDNKLINIGSYDTKEEAIHARILKEIELFGEQKTNFHYNTFSSEPKLEKKGD